MKGAATITATYTAVGGGRFRVYIRPANGQRASRTVKTMQEARDLAHHFNRLGMAGVDLAQAYADARAAREGDYPPLRDALGPFLDEQVLLGNLRKSTAAAYKNRLATWLPTKLGDTPWHLVRRDEIGHALLEIRKAGKSAASVEQVRCPIARFYHWQLNVHGFTGPNPAADLKFYVGKQPSKRGRKRDLQWFPQDEARALLKVAKAAKPRWYPFLLIGFTGGLRWGEITALERTDLDFARERVHVQRTWSEDGGQLERTKDDEDRWVKLPTPTIAAVQGHLEAMALEAQLHKWNTDQRRLVFPNTVGRITRYGTFHEHVWRELLDLAKVPYRKPHAMRHSYATWQLEDGADLRWVKDQMGHASIEETESTYGHLVRERHEQRVDLGSLLGL